MSIARCLGVYIAVLLIMLSSIQAKPLQLVKDELASQDLLFLQQREKSALVIGIGNYKNADAKTCASSDQFCDLEYPKEDAQTFHQLLLNEHIVDIPESNVTMLLDEEATLLAIRRSFGKLINQVKDDLVIIYYAGYVGQGPDFSGDEEKDGIDEYYIPYDYKLGDLYSTAIRDDEIRNWFADLDVKIIMILDSYLLEEKKLITPMKTSDFDFGHEFMEFAGKNTLLLGSVQNDIACYYVPQVGHNLFTYGLLQGLADGIGEDTLEPDLDSDNCVTTVELVEYAQEKLFRREVCLAPFILGDPLLKQVRWKCLPIPEVCKGKRGKITAIEGEKKQAGVGDHVLINLGSEDGIGVGDIFEVYHQFSSKGVVITEVRGKVKVIDVIEDHRSICEVTETSLPIEVWDKVRKVKE